MASPIFQYEPDHPNQLSYFLLLHLALLVRAKDCPYMRLLVLFPSSFYAILMVQQEYDRRRRDCRRGWCWALPVIDSFSAQVLIVLFTVMVAIYSVICPGSVSLARFGRTLGSECGGGRFGRLRRSCVGALLGHNADHWFFFCCWGRSGLRSVGDEKCTTEEILKRGVGEVFGRWSDSRLTDQFKRIHSEGLVGNRNENGRMLSPFQFSIFTSEKMSKLLHLWSLFRD